MSCIYLINQKDKTLLCDTRKLINENHNKDFPVIFKEPVTEQDVEFTKNNFLFNTNSGQTKKDEFGKKIFSHR